MTKISFTNQYLTDADGLLVHKTLYEATFGPVPKYWVVHHVNDIKDDNRLENLIAVPVEFETWLQRSGREYLYLARQGHTTKPLLAYLLHCYMDHKLKLTGGLMTALFDLRVLRFHVPKST